MPAPLPHHAVLFLDLQVGEAPHRLRRQRVIRRRVQELPVARHRADEAVVDRDFLQIGFDVAQLRNRAAVVAVPFGSRATRSPAREA